MTEDGWQELREPWERLRWSRARRFEAAKDAAESMGMKPDTYRAYEREPGTSKHTQLDHQSAIRFGRKFGVRWEWLLIGQGTPSDDEDEGPGSRVRAAMRSVPRDEQEAIADAVEALVRGRRR
jgi:hypothetical protein